MAACLAQSDAPSPRMLTVGRSRSPSTEMRETGLRGVLVYCHCGHHGELHRWADDVLLSDLEPRFVFWGAALGEPTFGPDFECGDARLAIVDHPGSDQFRSKSQVQTDNNRMAKNEPTTTTAVALIANRTLQVSSNRRLVRKRRPWWPQHRAGGHDDAGASGQALASWDRGRHPRDTTHFRSAVSSLSNYSRICIQIPTALLIKGKGRRRRSGTTLAAGAATFRTIGAALFRALRCRSYRIKLPAFPRANIPFRNQCHSTDCTLRASMARLVS